MRGGELIRAKHAQAAGFMRERRLDAWLISFARETGLRPDPLAYLVGAAVTWPSAFLLDRDGHSTAIVASGDATTFRRMDAWDEVRPYVASPREELAGWLDQRRPASIGVSWSDSDDTADAITHGMYVYLHQLLEGTPHAERLVEAGWLAGLVRTRKLPAEVAAIEHAVAETERLLDRIQRELRPGVSEAEFQRRVWGWIEEAGHGYAWDRQVNPMVNFGALAGLGHVGPQEDRVLAPGDVIHIDVGLVVEGFASDIQRTWYWARPGESAAPPAVQRAFDATLAAIEAGVAAMRPGARGHEVDAASRATLAEWDFAEPQFAFGHHCGRVAHDGGGVLGPRWERYGRAPEFELAPGNVFAVEMDIEPEGYPGIVGVEDEVLVEADGSVRFLGHRQTELKLLGG